MVFTVLGRPLWSLQEADWLLCGNNFFVGNHSALCGGGEGGEGVDCEWGRRGECGL